MNIFDLTLYIGKTYEYIFDLTTIIHPSIFDQTYIFSSKHLISAKNTHEFDLTLYCNNQ